MAEVNTDAEAKADAAFNAAFTAHSDDTPPVAKVVEEPKAAEPAVAPVPAPVPAPEKPQYVRVTKQEWDNAKAEIGRVAPLASQLAKLTNAIPKAEQIAQQVIETVRAQTPAGTAIDPQVLIDAFADQEKDFPELAGQNRKALEHVFKNLRGTGPATSPAQTVDFSAEVEKAIVAREHKALKTAYSDWRDIVGAPSVSGDQPADTAYRRWLAKEPADYQKFINETDSPAEVRDSISRFMASQSASASPSPRPDKAAARRAVMQDAVTPRADGNPPPLNRPQTAEEAFGNAFQKAKSH